MKITAVLFACSLSLFLVSSDAAAGPRQRDKCSPEAAANINAAVQFINDHMGQLQHPPFSMGRRGKTRRIRRRMGRKLSKMKYRCGRPRLCSVGGRRNARHNFGIMGRKIHLCYENMVSKHNDFCTFVGTVTHEYGHAVGVPADKDHDRGSDRVYQFGRFATQLCKDAGLNRPMR